MPVLEIMYKDEGVFKEYRQRKMNRFMRVVLNDYKRDQILNSPSMYTF